MQFESMKSMSRAGWIAPLLLACSINLKSARENLLLHPSSAYSDTTERTVSQKKKKYVIVGAGVAGRSCLSQLVSTYGDESSKDILLIDSNPDILHSIKYNTPSVKTSSLPIIDLNAEEQTLMLSSGEVVHFDKCLLAMGKETGKIDSNLLSPACSPEHVVYFQSSTSNKQQQFLRSLVAKHRHVTVLGGSWNSLFIAR
jgi:NADH dehydrogenase FAD-containing subunit